MADGTASFRQDSSGPALLRIRICSHSVSNTRLSRSAAGLSRPFFYQMTVNVSVLQPRPRRNAAGLGSSAFARRYLRNHFCFLFLQVLRCFSSLRSPLILGNDSSSHWVPPFGNLRVKGYLHLTGAYRSLSRPSSPLRAQASPVRSYLTFSSRVSIVSTRLYLYRPFLRLILSRPALPRTAISFSYMSLLSNMSKISGAFAPCERTRVSPLPALCGRNVMR